LEEEGDKERETDTRALMAKVDRDMKSSLKPEIELSAKQSVLSSSERATTRKK
jgi:hypothetical protein